MASLFNRSGSYYAQFDDADRTPKRRRLSLRTRDKRLARQLLHRADEAYRLGTFDPWVSSLDDLEPERPAAPLSVSEAVADYLGDRADALRPTTIIDRESVLRRFTEAVGGAVPVARLKADDLKPFCLAPEIAEGTRRKRVAYVRIWLKWCKAQGHVTDNVGALLRTPRKVDPTRSVHRKAVRLVELNAICQEAERAGHTWKAQMYRFTFYSGLRVSEVARLDWRDVDLDARTITISEQKNRRTTILPISQKAAGVLAEIAEEADRGHVFVSPLQRKPERNVRAFCASANKDFTAFRDLAGIDRPVSYHGLRHGFASHLADNGASAWVVQAACRHSSIAVSQVYVSLASKTLSNELDSAFG
ncbi:tyrosine-type recombinase/integrase [Rubrivirga litoralis]|uniref:Tyrosine-type recombinase/integrase n=1 Tax=Rubrivirga litoralis TaxID=3075598 RepID=A0ABU3BPY5_9BACT|nr:tyrosine-type recombinase/integrase [Rubrivirga sp. F394]MDT0631325.1 tyrosine-type recombinase/integrase [Rubrivirga sp. F394]